MSLVTRGLGGGNLVTFGVGNRIAAVIKRLVLGVESALSRSINLISRLW